MPLTGEAASFGTIAAGARAYFDHVNAQGGVHGRKISYRTYDDAYNPALTVQLTRRLVEEDESSRSSRASGRRPTSQSATT